MIVRIQQLALEDAERSSGWPDQGLAGPIAHPWPAADSAFEIVVAAADESGRQIPQRLRRDHLRSIIPSVIESLRQPGLSVVTRLDGSLADGGILVALSHLPDPQSRGRFVVSHIQKLDPEPALVIASVRVEHDFERLETLCADPGLDLNFAVRFRAFAVPDELVNPLLDIAEMDDERWPELLSQMAFAVQPSAGMDAIQVITSRYGAAEFTARLNTALAGAVEDTLGMTAIILSIGDELVLGQTVDTNSAWLSQQLAAVGVAVLAHATVADDQPAIEQTIREASSRCDVLLISGGIGPTEDDLTRQALAEVMQQPLELNESWLARLEAFFKRVGRAMPPTNRIQAMLPRTADMIDNAAGTACGIHSRVAACDVYVMPGVPGEMKRMFAGSVLPAIKERGGGAVILSRTLHTFGLGESSIAEKLGPLMKRDRNPSVGTTVSQGIVSLRINARFADRDEAGKQLEQTIAFCRAALGELIYGQDEQTLQMIVGQLLRESGKSVATAESCTGGLLAKMLTDVPGSSAYFRQGWVTYSDESKTRLLGVAPELIEAHGAVSEPVVQAMAAAAAQRAGADFALAISGIAGPDGGTPAKPVGTVCIALASGSGVTPRPRTFHFTGDREMIRDRSAKMALTILRFALSGRPMPF